MLKVCLDWQFMIKIKIKWIEKYISWENWCSNLFCIDDKNFQEIIYIDRLPLNKDPTGILWLYEPKTILIGLHKKLTDIVKSKRVKAIFTHDEQIISDIKKYSNIPIFLIEPYFKSWIPIDQQKIYKKTKLISMISSNRTICQGHYYRQEIYNLVMNRVDCYGRGRNEIPCKTLGLKDYMFSIAMENTIIDTYYTEKILDCFLLGTVPIYWGTKNINKIFDEKGIIFFNTQKELMNILNNISFEKYKEMLPSIINNYKIASNMFLETKYGIEKILKISMKEKIIN